MRDQFPHAALGSALGNIYVCSQVPSVDEPSPQQPYPAGRQKTTKSKATGVQVDQSLRCHPAAILPRCDNYAAGWAGLFPPTLAGKVGTFAQTRRSNRSCTILQIHPRTATGTWRTCMQCTCKHRLTVLANMYPEDGSALPHSILGHVDDRNTVVRCGTEGRRLLPHYMLRVGWGLARHEHAHHQSSHMLTHAQTNHHQLAARGEAVM